MKTRILLLSLLLAGCSVTGGGLGGLGGRGEAPAAGGDAAPALPPLDMAEDVDPAPVQPPITGSCGMEELQHYVGQPRTSVPLSAMPENFRVVGPDTVVTMDYRPDRLTVRIDENDMVIGMACG